MFVAQRPRRRRFPLITRWGLVRLAVVCGVLAYAGGCMFWMPGKSYRDPLPPLSDDQRALSETLRAHVTHLAQTIGQRNIWNRDNLHAAADYIQAQLEAAGYAVNRQPYQLRSVACDNLEVQITGRADPDAIVIVGAHYDSVFDSPGANDNATGIAALLALARTFADKTPARTLRFVAFVNEEPPFFRTELMGSTVYAKRCRQRGDNIVAMISFDGLGCYTDQPDSQHYPFPFGLLYPSTGNFIGFLGDTSSRKLVRRAIGTFRRHARFPSEAAAVPRAIEGVGWSDHWSFWQAGYPAIMITDTLPFRYAHYHAHSDTPDKLDYDRMARVVEGLVPVINDLTGHTAP